MRIMVRILALGCALLLGASHAHSSDDWKQPEYWGLKKGAYIPAPECWDHWDKKHAYEVCATVIYL